MQHAAGLGDEVLLALLDEAAAIVRSQAPTITKRGRGGAVIRMPYLLATVRGLIEATDETIGTPDAGAMVTSVMVDPRAPDADDPPATTTAEVLWRAVVGEVRRDVTAENYSAWFAPTRALALDGDLLRVGVPTPFHCQWLEHKLHGCVDRALGRLGHVGVRVAYAVAALEDAATAGDQASDRGKAPTALAFGAASLPLPAPRATPTTAFVPPPVTTPIPRLIVTCGAAPPLALTCSCCRAAPCSCRLGDRLRRAIVANGPPPAAAAAWGGAL